MLLLAHESDQLPLFLGQIAGCFQEIEVGLPLAKCLAS